ncbi:hypothetical protein IWQ62_003032, partial [Dispira parvispora]
CKELDEKSYNELKVFEGRTNKTAEEEDKILDNLREKWEQKKKECNLDRISPKQLNYEELKDVELFMYYPLLYARKHGSPRFVAQLLSLIKGTLLDGRGSVYWGNADTVPSVAIDDVLFYEVIIPQVLLAYVYNDIDKAKEFVKLTTEEPYRLYDKVNGDDDNIARKHWPGTYIEFIDYITEYGTSEA